MKIKFKRYYNSLIGETSITYEGEEEGYVAEAISYKWLPLSQLPEKFLSHNIGKNFLFYSLEEYVQYEKNSKEQDYKKFWENYVKTKPFLKLKQISQKTIPFEIYDYYYDDEIYKEFLC